MAQVTLNGINFSNINVTQSIVSNGLKNSRTSFTTNGKIDTNKITNSYNAVQSGTVNWSNIAFINAIDIDWNGAKPGMGESNSGINTTGELLSTIKNYIDNQSGYNSGIGTLDTNSKYKLVLNGTTYGPGNVDTVTTLGPSNGFWAPTSIGTAGQVLKSNGTELVWETDNNATYSAGTGLSLSGTTINHSNSVTAKSSGLYKIAFDAQGHITSATAVTVDDLRALLDNVYEPKSNPVTLSSIAWKTTTGASNVGTTVNTSVVTNKIICTWSDNTTTEVNETGFNVYTNSACTNAASNDWYNTAGTYYIKGTYNGKTTTNYITWTINAAQPQTSYYYYAGWTLPTTSNVDSIIAETYPASSGSSTNNTAGKKTTSKSTMDYTSNTLYNANSKATYYVLVPTGHAIYDSLNNNVIASTFTSQGNITVGNQTHTIYASNSTSRNINAIIIK